MGHLYNQQMNEKDKHAKIDIPLPQDNYETALKIVIKELGALDFAERAEAAGATWLASQGIARIKMLDRNLHVTASDLDVTDPAGGKVELWEEILLLHYLLHATGKTPTGKLISYKEIPDGRPYWPNFVARVHKPLLAAFASNPQSLHSAAARFDGVPCDGGDAAVLISALPHVDIIYILYKGDDEFEPQAACLFDETITDYLPTEDITMLAGMTAIKMLKASMKGKS